MNLSPLIIAGILVSSPLLAKVYTLEEAIKTALLNNQKQVISLQQRAIAKAKYQEALSADYPTLDITLLANRHDEPFVDKTDTSFQLPPSFGGGVVPIKYTHTVMGRDTASAKAEAKYALYTGGKISALQDAAHSGVLYADEDAKLTKDKIIFDIKKYYATVMLSQRLEKLMQDTVDRMQTTYELTERFYKGDSLKVKKTDYLRSKMMLLNMQSMLESFKNAKELALSAFRFEMGLKESADVSVSNDTLEIKPLQNSLEAYYKDLYIKNHELKKVSYAMDARKAEVQESESGYLPAIALYANAKSLYNNENGGIVNSQNNDAWNVGVVVKYNLFSGGLTKAKTQEAKAEELALKAQQAYLKSGLELKAKKAFLDAKTALRQIKTMKEAVSVAKENSDLNLRAYETEMVETKDVLESQFLRSLTEASYYKVQYQAIVSEANLDYIVGTSLK